MKNACTTCTVCYLLEKTKTVGGGILEFRLPHLILKMIHIVTSRASTVDLLTLHARYGFTWALLYREHGRFVS